MSLLDRVKGWLYDAAEPTHERSARAIIGDRHTLASEDQAVSSWERDTLIAQCRDILRNNPIARGLVKRLMYMVVGQGITAVPATSDEAWNRKAAAYWRRWADYPEPTGQRSLADMLGLAVSGILVEGGAAVLLHSAGTIELIELDRFRSHKDSLDKPPYKRNSSGLVTKWCIWDRDDSGFFGIDGRCSWVGAENVLTLFPTDRADQVLPVPQLASCVNTLRDINELNGYTLRQAKIQSLAALVHKRGTDGGKLNIGGSRNAQTAASAADKTLKDLASAYDFSFIDTTGDVHSLGPATPGSTYDSFMMLNLKLIAMAIGIPLDVMMLWFSDGTYSSSKATLTQARMAIADRQQALVRSILRPLWQWRIAKAVGLGELPAPPVREATGMPDYDSVAWQMPAYEWVDPSDTLQNDLVSIKSGLSTMSSVCEKRGTTLEDTMRAKIADIRLVRKLAAEAGISPAELSDITIPGAANNGGPEF